MSINLDSLQPSDALANQYKNIFGLPNSPTYLHEFKLNLDSEIPELAENSLLSEHYRLQILKEWRCYISKTDLDKQGWHYKIEHLILAALTGLGTVYFACEGFDGITALLSVVQSVFSMPVYLMFGFGIIFAILSVIIFYSFDLEEIKSNLGVNWQQAIHLVDIYVEQLDEMKAIIQSIEKLIVDDFQEQINLSQPDKEALFCLLQQLEEHYEYLVTQSRQLQHKLEHPLIDATQSTVTFLAGLIHFSGGFFAGQTVATFVCAALSLSTSPAFFPILMFSLLIGCAAVANYWFVEKPSIEKFVSRWVGIDKVKLEKLQKPERIEKKMVQIGLLNRTLGMFNQTANNMAVSDGPVENMPQSLHIQG